MSLPCLEYSDCVLTCQHRFWLEYSYVYAIMRAMREKEGYLHIRVSKEWLEKLDSWRKAQAVSPTRSEAVRIAVERFVESNLEAAK